MTAPSREPAARSEYNRAYRLAHLEQITARQKERRRVSPERLAEVQAERVERLLFYQQTKRKTPEEKRESRKRWEQSHREYKASKQREYAARHREERAAYAKRYVQANREKVMAIKADRVMIMGELLRISHLHPDLQPIARLIRETRLELRKRSGQ